MFVDVFKPFHYIYVYDELNFPFTQILKFRGTKTHSLIIFSYVKLDLFPINLLH